MYFRPFMTLAALMAGTASIWAYDVLVNRSDGQTFRATVDQVESITFDGDGSTVLTFTGDYSDHITVGAESGEIALQFDAPMYWIVSSKPSADWLRLGGTSGLAGDNRILLSVDRNDADTDRIATFRLMCGFSELTVEVVQTSLSSSPYVNIPDANFLAAVLESYDTDSDGRLSKEEALNVRTLNIAYKDIESLEGIKSMINLENLDCSNNLISGHLDLSGLEKLRELRCVYNACSSISLAGCSALQTLTANDLVTYEGWVSTFHLKEIDLSGCRSLSYINLQDNALTAIDLSDCTALEDLHLELNSLNSINISGCSKLKWAHIRNNKFGGGAMDFSGCPEIQGIFAGDMGLGSINIAGCGKLRELTVSNNQLSALDLSGCGALEQLTAFSNNLSSIDVSGCPSLQSLWASFNKLSEIDLSSNPKLTYVSLGWNELEGEIDLTANDRLTNLMLQSNPMTDLRLAYSPELRMFDVTGSRLSALDLRNAPAVEQVSANENRLESVDLSNCQALRMLKVSDNRLKELDLSNNKYIVTLEAENNMLADLDLTPCSELGELLVKNNNLHNINLRGCSKLVTAEIYNNMLDKLDLTGCVSLVELHFHNNNIEYFSPRTCPMLNYVDCRNNGIRKGIDFSYNDNLQIVFGTGNPDCLLVYLSENAPNERIEFDPACSVYLGHPKDFDDVGGGNWGDDDLDMWN